MSSAKEIDDDLIKLLLSFTHRRISRVIMYLLLFVGSVFSIFAPSELLLQETSSGLAKTWSVLFAVAAVSCFVGSLMDRWFVEYVMIPLLGSIMIVFGIALLVSAVSNQTPLIVPYALFFSAFSFGLLARWRDVQSLLRIVVATNAEEK